MTDASRQAAAPAYAALAHELLARLDAALAARGAHGIVVGVAGESGSGKTVTAVSLARALEGRGLAAAVLHQDDYFLRPPRANHAWRELDLAHVGPHEVNLALLAEHIGAFRARRRDVPAPVVDYPSDRFLVRHRDFSTLDALVVEGTYVLSLDDLDARIFLDATYEDTRARRLERARDVDSPFVERVLRIEHALIAPQAARADLVVDRDFRVRERARPG